MSNKTHYIPEGYHTITPYLIIDNAGKAIEFYKKAFDAKTVMCMETPDKKIAHAEMAIGDSKFMLGDECAEMDAKSPKAYGGTPIGMHIYVKDVDATVRQAIDCGAKLVKEVKDQFYGDRSGAVEDPFGHSWYIATHIEDVSEEEIRKRAVVLFGPK